MIEQAETVTTTEEIGERRENAETELPTKAPTVCSADVPQDAFDRMRDEDRLASAWIAHHLVEQQTEHLFRTAFLLGARFALDAREDDPEAYDGLDFGDSVTLEAGVLWRVYEETIFRREDFESGLKDHKPMESKRD